jgi:ribosomal RNA-processing protein 12
VTGDAFQDVLYGSESELEDSDDEGGDGDVHRQGAVRGARLAMDNDEPMDLLQGAAARITSTFSRHRPEFHHP